MRWNEFGHLDGQSSQLILENHVILRFNPESCQNNSDLCRNYSELDKKLSQFHKAY